MVDAYDGTGTPPHFRLFGTWKSRRRAEIVTVADGRIFADEEIVEGWRAEARRWRRSPQLGDSEYRAPKVPPISFDVINAERLARVEARRREREAA